MINMIRITEKYGGLAQGQSYVLLESAVDWHKISFKGSPLYIPHWVGEVVRDYQQEEVTSYDDWIS